MVLYIGNEIKGKWLEDVIKHFEEEAAYVPPKMKVEDQVNDILDHSGSCTAMIFEADQYTEESAEVIEQILRVQKVNNAKVILYAPGFLPSSALIMDGLRAGIKNFVLGTNLSDQKDQLRKCLNGYYDAHYEDEFGYAEPILETDEIKETLSLNNIGIAGANRRMGTTTQAIQIIKYLMLKGYKACYIEMNDHGWVKNLEQWYEVDKDPLLGRVTYGSVDMFWDLTKLQTVLKQGYDYYVFDYGTITDTDFDRNSFLRENVSIFVCGSGPSELSSTFELLKSSFYNDVVYLFSLTPEEDHKEILEMMEEKSTNTYFSEYCPDPFTVCNISVYEKMLPVEDINPEQEQKKKPFRFPFRRKKNG